MSTTQLVRQFHRVADTINRFAAGYREEEGSNSRTVNDPLREFAHQLQPHARTELMRILNHQALHQPLSQDRKIARTQLGLVGDFVEAGRSDLVLDQIHERHTGLQDRIAKTMGLAIMANKTDILKKISAYAQQNLLKIDENYLRDLQTIAVEYRNLEAYEDVQALKYAQNQLFSRNDEGFLARATRSVNEDILKAVRNTNPDLDSHRNFTASLFVHVQMLDADTHYDSSLDEIGVDLIRSALKEKFPDKTDMVHKLMETLENKRKVDPESEEVSTGPSAKEILIRNTQNLHSTVIAALETGKYDAAISEFGDALVKVDKAQYDPNLDKAGLTIIKAKTDNLVAVSRLKQVPQYLVDNPLPENFETKMTAIYESLTKNPKSNRA